MSRKTTSKAWTKRHMSKHGRRDMARDGRIKKAPYRARSGHRGPCYFPPIED